jgi:hypothetical protein
MTFNIDGPDTGFFMPKSEAIVIVQLLRAGVLVQATEALCQLLNRIETALAGGRTPTGPSLMSLGRGSYVAREGGGCPSRVT